MIDAVLAAGYRAIAIDLRGHGTSSKPLDSERYGIEMVRDVVRLLDHLDVERAHVVGYSLGGASVLIRAVTAGDGPLTDEEIAALNASLFARNDPAVLAPVARGVMPLYEVSESDLRAAPRTGPGHHRRT